MTDKIDDSALLHGEAYDPQKAHAYYLRTRKLKGRHPGDGRPTGSRSAGGSSQGGGGGGTSNSVLRPSQREHLLAEKKRLENRLDYLKQLLEEAVNAAKKRSGVKSPPKDTKSSTTEKKGAASKKGTPDKPLTAAQKAQKRKDSKERYQKEKRTTLSTDVATLHRQISDIRAKLDAAYKDARLKSDQSKPQTASNGR